jgi:hypothetical protein
MEGLTRLVAESLARHGFDRPVDYRRLHWSRWFHCESPHSLLCVPSKPGVFALAEEVMEFGKAGDGPGTAAESRRMLAVVQFGEDEDMAFVLDRMFSLQNPMRARLASGRCFVRFVVIEDEAHRRSIAGALNQWMVTSGEKASGIGAHFASSLELTPANGTNRAETAARVEAPASASSAVPPVQVDQPELKLEAVRTPDQISAPHLDSGAATNIHCPQPLPSGF